MKNSTFLLFIVGGLFLGFGCAERDDSGAGIDAAEQAAFQHEQINWDGYEVQDAYGEIIYVPIYSRVFDQSGRTFSLTATLSIHNVDLEHPIRLIRVNYYNTDGRLIRRYLDKPELVRPLQTRQFLIPSVDTTGGTGANFVAQWLSESDVTSPIVEAVMISTTSQQGLSLTTMGKVIGRLHQEK